MTAAQSAFRWPPRTWLAAGISVAVLALAVAGGTRSSPAALGPLIAVESVSARVSGILLSLGTKAPLGYAFVAGMVASVNPCGFVLLPAYLGYYLGDDRGARRGRGGIGRAVAVSATMTVSFALLFGLAGILAGLAASALSSSLAWIGTAVGVGLILLAGVLASGRELTASAGPRMAGHLWAAARIRGLGGYAAYGTAYGLASLGCTLPVFLGVVGTSLQLHGLADAVGQFVLFGIGMGSVLGLLTIVTAWSGDGLLGRAQRLRRHVSWASAVLLWLAGAYIVYYWLTAIRLSLNPAPRLDGSCGQAAQQAARAGSATSHRTGTGESRHYHANARRDQEPGPPRRGEVTSPIARGRPHGLAAAGPRC